MGVGGVVKVLKIFVLTVSYSNNGGRSTSTNLRLARSSIICLLTSGIALKVGTLFPFVSGSKRRCLAFRGRLRPRVYICSLRSKRFIGDVFFSERKTGNINVFKKCRVVSFSRVCLPDLRRDGIFIVRRSNGGGHRVVARGASSKVPLLPFKTVAFTCHPVCFGGKGVCVPRAIGVHLKGGIVRGSPICIIISAIGGILDSFPVGFPPVVSSSSIAGPSLNGRLSCDYYLGSGSRFMFSFFFSRSVCMISLRSKRVGGVGMGDQCVSGPTVGRGPPRSFSKTVGTDSRVPYCKGLVCSGCQGICCHFMCLGTSLSKRGGCLGV